jgi:hypothetical protein
MNFKFCFDNSRLIFYKYYSGVISFSDFVSSWQYIISNNFFPGEARGILLDYRNAMISSPIDEASRISDFFAGNTQVFQNKKIAFVTSTPEQIVIPMLIREYDFNYHSRPFSTIEAAESWIADPRL